MDIISHGLWSSAPFLQKSKKNYWLAFLIGISPDLFSFGILFVLNILGIFNRPNWEAGPPPMEAIPDFVHVAYNFTHSLVIFAVFFFLIWLIFKKPFWPLVAWGIHILIDIPTHSAEFFPTPFLFPISDFRVNGVSWGEAWIFFPNWILLIILYGGYFVWRKFFKKNVI